MDSVEVILHKLCLALLQLKVSKRTWTTVTQAVELSNLCTETETEGCKESS